MDKQYVARGLVSAILLSVILVAAFPRPSFAESPATTTVGLGKWDRIAEYPGGVGVAGPFVGVSNDALIVAGGANFSEPIWESAKAWHDQIHVLVKHGDSYRWSSTAKLPRQIAYGASVTTGYGVVCMGGNNAAETFDDCFVLRWNPEDETVERISYPSLPSPCAYGQAAVIGDVIYLAGGQRDSDLGSAMRNFWALDLSDRNNADAFCWKELAPIPGAPRAYNLTIAHQQSDESYVYVISGRHVADEATAFLSDTWAFATRSNRWRRGSDVPRCVMAGTGIGSGSQLFVLGGADGSLFYRADELKNDHPGFPAEALVYNPTTDRWASAGPIPQNHVTTVTTKWDDHIIVASGEIRPRVRSTAIWSISPVSDQSERKAK